MRSAFTIVMILFSFILVGDNVRQNSGARHSFQQNKSGVVNPYVTDGLVAMFDGEWNIGCGKHSDTATTWVDLIGGTEAIPTTSDFWWNDNHLETTNKCAFKTSIGRGWTEATVEVVGKYNGRNHTNAALVGSFGSGCTDSSGNKNYGGVCIGMMTYYVRSNWYAAAPWSYVQQPTGMLVSDIFPFSVTWAGANKNAICYVRGEENSRKDSSTLAINFNPWCIGATHSTGGENMFGEFYIVRFYNRALSPEEVMHNYQIDKARFGL